MILGLDFDTRAVHAVLLDDDDDEAAVYVPVPFVNHKPPFQFDDARAVRGALNAAIQDTRKSVPVAHGYGSILWPRDGWDSIWLVGIEKPYSQSTDSAWKYGLVVGQILSCVPRAVPVIDLPPQEWKRETVGKANASKDEVANWACSKLAHTGSTWLAWPQDAYDAFSIAYAARALNQRGIEAA